MTDYGLKISKSGKDVKTATGDDLVFSSAYNSPKVVLSGSVSESIAANSEETKTISHNLGYTPAYLFYWRGAGQTKARFLRGLHEVDPEVIDSYADGSNLYIDLDNGSGSAQTIYIQYFVFADQGT